MSDARPRFLPAGDQAVVVEFGDTIEPAVNRQVRDLALAIETTRPDGIVDLVPTYRSLLVYYDPRRCTPSRLEAELTRLIEEAATTELPPPRVLDVPTCYGGEFGPDLDFVAKHAGLAPDEVVAIHTSDDYLVYMMGFTPGFTYLGGMSEKIAAPRLQTPRTIIPAGSVGIAQKQTGIYPVDSPGGWQLIGRTPLRLFDPLRQPPVLVEAGDFIRFVRVDRAAYDEVERQIAAGRYEPAIGVRR